jgi:hypothetical protein
MTLMMIVFMLIGMLGLAPPGVVAAQQSSLPPMITGEIVVESYDCETSDLILLVPVADLPAAPEGTSTFELPLNVSWSATYESGSGNSSPISRSPAANDSPFTGDFRVSLIIPSTNMIGAAPSGTVIISIDFFVSVGPLGYAVGKEGTDGPTDTAELTYIPDCDEGGPDEVGLVEQLVAALKRVLSSILNR